MSGFAGKICPYCKTAFTDQDEVVVCSQCEMPHHKDCWVENRACTTFGCTGTIQAPEGAAPVPQYHPPQPAPVYYPPQPAPYYPPQPPQYYPPQPAPQYYPPQSAPQYYPPAPPQVRFCPRCGNPRTQEARFCARCGCPLERSPHGY